MGSRASYVIRVDGRTRAYGSHWGASSLIDDLLWGPDYATGMFGVQEELDDLAEIAGGDEGCALIDWDKRRLMWSAAHCRLPVQQRLINRMLAETWPGWSVSLATHGIDDLLEYLGIQAEPPDGEGDDADGGEVETEFDEEMLYPPDPVTGPIADLAAIRTGNWLTILGADGSCRDYFGMEELDECLAEGPRLVEHVRQLPRLEDPPPELVTTGGAILDQRERVLWRWEGPRYPWREKQLRAAWEGWTLKDLPDQWHGQLHTTGRKADGLAGGERWILGATIAGLVNRSARDPRRTLAKMATLSRGVRLGCAVTTVLVGVAGGSLAWWWHSTGASVAVGLLVLFCLWLTIRVWRKTSFFLSVTDMMASSGQQDAPAPQSLTAAEKLAVLDSVLTRLGYPTVAQLEAAGELKTADEPEAA